MLMVLIIVVSPDHCVLALPDCSLTQSQGHGWATIPAITAVWGLAIIVSAFIDNRDVHHLGQNIIFQVNGIEGEMFDWL